MRDDLTSTLKGVLTALLWVLLGLGSLACTVVALWVCLSMAKAAAVGERGFGASTPWLWFIAVLITLGLPFALATWKHQGDARRISLTMAWLPMLWNAGGLIIATQIVPNLMATALRSQGAWVAADRLGDADSTTRVLSALGHHTADVISPEPEARPEPIVAPPLRLEETKGVDLSKAISVPFTEEGTAILMNVALEGNNGQRLELPYLFDTGASYTTINSETAGKLGIVVPDDAPTLTFNTASGPRESKMVYLPALQLGAVRIEGLLVSVCDRCVNGLLGQNVMREFFAQIDYKNQHMVLIPRVSQDRPNRAYDIEPVVQLKLDGPPEVWLGRVHWVVLVENHSTVALRDVVPEVKFADGPVLRGETIAEIPAGEIGRSLVKGRATVEGGKDKRRHYSLRLAEAFW